MTTLPPTRRPSPSRRCEEHGLLYNPDRFPGCAVCREAPPTPPPRFGWSPFGLAAAAVVAVGMFFGLGRAVRGVADRGEQVYSEAQETAGKLDPAPYDDEIKALESLVYSPSPEPFGHGSRILAAAAALSEAMGGDDNPALDATLRSHGQAILMFGERIAATEDVGYGGMNLKTAQTDWEELRGETFVDAEWFRRGTGEGPSSEAGPTMARSTVRLLNDLAVEIGQLIQFGRSTALPMPEPDAPPASAEAGRLRRDWENFQHSWGGRLRMALQRMPEGKRWLSADAERANRNLRLATDQLTAMVRASVIPRKQERLRYLDEAALYLARAKELLERISR